MQKTIVILLVLFVCSCAVEVSYQGGVQRIDVPRDTKVTVEIGGSRYEWYYPSLYINPDGKATSDKAFLILTRLP